MRVWESLDKKTLSHPGCGRTADWQTETRERIGYAALSTDEVAVNQIYKNLRVSKQTLISQWSHAGLHIGYTDVSTISITYQLDSYAMLTARSDKHCEDTKLGRSSRPIRNQGTLQPTSNQQDFLLPLQNVLVQSFASPCKLTTDWWQELLSWRKLCYRKDDGAIRAVQYTCISGLNESLRRYGHSKLSKMEACRQLGFDVTGNSAIRSADHENATLEPNMKCIGSPVAQIWPFAYLGNIWNPQFGGRGGRRGQRWHHSKERWRFPIGSGSPLLPLRYL